MAVKNCARELLTETEKLASDLKAVLAQNISDVDNSLKALVLRRT